jgi:hypothetical protein
MREARMGEVGASQDGGAQVGEERHRGRAKRAIGCVTLLVMVAFAIALAPALVGTLLGLTIGVILLLAVCGIPPAYALRTLELLVMGRNRPLLPAYVLLAGQFGLSILAVRQQVPTANVSAIIVAVGLTWLLLRPGRVVAALLVIFGCYMVVGHGVVVLAGYPRLATSEGAAVVLAGYTFDALLWLATMWLVVRGLRIIRRTAAPAEATPQVGYGENI